MNKLIDHNKKKESQEQIKKMKLSEWMQGYSDEEKICKNCFYIARPIREDLENEKIPCNKKGKFVCLTDSCSEFEPFRNSNPADFL